MLTALSVRHVPTSSASSTRLWCAAWNDAGNVLATAGDDHAVRIWKLLSVPPYLECRTTLSSSHTRAVRSVAFSHDGRYLASASFDATVVIYERGEDGEFEETNKLEGHESEVKAVAFSPSDEFLATCSRDKSVWFWQIDEEEDFQVSSILQPHTADVKAVAWHPNQDILVSCSYDSSIRFYKYDGEDWVTAQHIADAHQGTVWSAAFDASGKRLVTAGEDHLIQLWLNTGEHAWKSVLKYEVKSCRWPLYSVSWGAVNDLIAIGGGDNRIRIFRVDGGASSDLQLAEVASYDEYEEDANSVAWHPKDPEMLAAVGDDGTLRLLKYSI